VAKRSHTPKSGSGFDLTTESGVLAALQSAFDFQYAIASGDGSAELRQRAAASMATIAEKAAARVDARKDNEYTETLEKQLAEIERLRKQGTGALLTTEDAPKIPRVNGSGAH
jgi:hypothetical protein